MCTIPAIPAPLGASCLGGMGGPQWDKVRGQLCQLVRREPRAPQAPVSSYLSNKLSLTAHGPPGNFHPADEARQISKQDCKFL